MDGKDNIHRRDFQKNDYWVLAASALPFFPLVFGLLYPLFPPLAIKQVPQKFHLLGYYTICWNLLKLSAKSVLTNQPKQDMITLVFRLYDDFNHRVRHVSA